jgi:hypothetical protein
MFATRSLNLWMLKGVHVAFGFLVKKIGIDGELKHFTNGLFEAINNGMSSIGKNIVWWLEKYGLIVLQ